MATTFQVTFDAHDPETLGKFWAEVLGYVEQPPPEGFDDWDSFADTVGIPTEDRGNLYAIIDPGGEHPRLLFQKVPEGKTAKNRVHLDVNVGAGSEGEERRSVVDRERARLEELGAEEHQIFESDREYWVVMHDPEGNEFCIQ